MGKRLFTAVTLFGLTLSLTLTAQTPAPASPARSRP